MHTIIFANGLIEASPLPLPLHDLLIAADGGARNAFRFGLVPDILIGDFDSLTEDEIAGFDRAGAAAIHHPAEKDETDLELALDFAADEGADAITLYGLFGGRWDMTFANLLLLATPRFAGIRLTIIAGHTKMHILHGGGSLQLTGTPGETVSILPLGGPAEGLSYKGLAWPLTDADLPLGSPRGVSNTLKHAQATITLRRGTVLVYHAQDN